MKRQLTLVAIAATLPSVSFGQFTVPDELKDPEIDNVIFAGINLSGLINIETDSGVVDIEWSWHATGNPKQRNDVKHQRITSAFLPTAADINSNGDLIVAGLDPITGNTVIEFWDVVPPDLPLITPTNPKPPLTGSSALQLKPLGMRRTLMNEKTAGRQLARSLFCPEDGSNRIYVQFWDSKDFLQLTWGAGGPPQWTLIVASTSFPELTSNGYRHFWRGHHSDWGYVYVMADFESLGATGPIYLADTDTDGEIDVWVYANIHQGEYPELRDLTKYSSLYAKDRP